MKKIVAIIIISICYINITNCAKTRKIEVIPRESYYKLAIKRFIFCINKVLTSTEFKIIDKKMAQQVLDNQQYYESKYRKLLEKKSIKEIEEVLYLPFTNTELRFYLDWAYSQDSNKVIGVLISIVFAAGFFYMNFR